MVNEFLPAPRDVDWDGDGTADYRDEWIELYCGGERDIDLGGWVLDDVEAGGSPPFTFPTGVVIQAGRFLLLYRRDTGVRLDNDGPDGVRLMMSDGTLADEVTYARHPGYDQSFSRTVDGAGEWTDEYEVTPGEPNRARTSLGTLWLPLISQQR